MRPRIQPSNYRLQRTASRLIKESSLAHRVELEASWNRVRAREPLERIAPLDQGDDVKTLPAVVRAEYRGEFKILVVFNDGVEGTVGLLRLAHRAGV